MKYLKKFENFDGQDLGRFSNEEEVVNSAEPIHSEEEEDIFSSEEDENDEEVMNYGTTSEDDEECAPCKDNEDEDEEHNWGDEDLTNPVVQTVERFAGFLEAKKAKPDFLDLDKDGNKKESMKKAAKDAKAKKEDKKEDKKQDKKEVKGLSAAQKKLPPALQKAIAAKKK